MIVCLFGVTYRDDYEIDLERKLEAPLYEQLKQIPGFLVVPPLCGLGR